MIEDVTEDGLLGGRITLLQPRGGHRAGTDAVLLASFVHPQPGSVVVDLGAGTGAVGLMVGAAAPATEIVLVERDPALVALCAENIRRNGMESRARALRADVLAPSAERRAAGLDPGCADLVATNPPFFNEARSRPSPDPRRATAHSIKAGGLEDWIRAAIELLKPGGLLVLIHRAESLGEVLRLYERKIGAIRVRAVHPRAEAAAIRILVSGVKGSRAPIALLPPLVLHGPDGRFTQEAAALHGGEFTKSAAGSGAA